MRISGLGLLGHATVLIVRIVAIIRSHWRAAVEVVRACEALPHRCPLLPPRPPKTVQHGTDEP